MPNKLFKFSDLTCTRRIQNRLRGQDIHVNNMLVRIIISHTFDQLVGLPKRHRMKFLDQWSKSLARQFWREKLDLLRGAYSERFMGNRAISAYTTTKRLSPMMSLTRAERAALITCRMSAEAQHDEELASAVQKCLDTMPMVNKK